MLLLLRKKIAPRQLFFLQIIIFIIFFHSLIFLCVNSSRFFLKTKATPVKISKAMVASRIGRISSRQLEILRASRSSGVTSSDRALNSNHSTSSNNKSAVRKNLSSRIPVIHSAKPKKNIKNKVDSQFSHKELIVTEALNLSNLLDCGLSLNELPVSTAYKKFEINDFESPVVILENVSNEKHSLEECELNLLQSEIAQIKGMSALSDLISVTWSPPRGVLPQQACIAEVLISDSGLISEIIIKQSSKIAAYDASVRVALDSINYPKWACGKLLSFTFGDE